MSAGKMHADEVYTDVSLVGRLLAAQFPQWTDLPIVPVPSAGTDNALYRLGQDMVVRLPRIHWAVDSVDREHQWLPWLAPRLPITIPVPLAKGTPAAGYPWNWSVYPWLNGENPHIYRLANPPLLAMELADFILALRRIDPTGGPPGSQTLAMQDDSVRRSIKILDEMKLIDTPTVTAAWDAALKLPEWEGPPVWLHGDLAGGNLLLVNGRLHAVIDFSATGVGDPSSDLRVAWNLLPASVRDVFRAALGADAATWSRGRGRAFAQALNQLSYYHQTNPTLAANARYVIQQVLTDYRSTG